MDRGFWDLTLDTAVLAVANNGLQELIILVLGVSLLDCLDWITTLLTIAQDHTLHGDLNSLPSLITVHGIVSTNNCCNLANSDLLGLLQQLLHVSSSRLGVGVSPVTKEMDVDMRDSDVLGNSQESVEVVLLGVL